MGGGAGDLPLFRKRCGWRGARSSGQNYDVRSGQATYVSVGEFDGQYFQLSFDTEDPGADFDLSAPVKPYL
jgi:hypothetical protein